MLEKAEQVFLGAVVKSYRLLCVKSRKMALEVTVLSK